MKIAIDLRSLSSGSISGVENYIVNVLDHLLKHDKKNSYTLFYNSWKNNFPGEFHYINSEVRRTFIPNKILNVAFKAGAINLERLVGSFDWLFMPNLNQYHITAQAKLAITVHDLSPVVAPEFYNLQRRVWHTFLNYKKAFQRANVIFAVSEYTKNDIVRLFGIPREKIKVIYPGITIIGQGILSQDYLREVRNRLGLPGDYFLFVNTIEPRKNVSNLIRAFEQLSGSQSLLIVGKPGWKYRRIFREIRSSKKSAKIKYMGYISEADKPAVMRLSRALVYPSFYEGFGFQPLEAMSLGVPTIVSSVTSLPEVVQNASLLVNPYQVPEIVRAMEVVSENEHLRQQLITKGYARSKEFDWNKTAEQILSNFT